MEGSLKLLSWHTGRESQTSFHAVSINHLCPPYTAVIIDPLQASVFFICGEPIFEIRWYKLVSVFLVILPHMLWQNFLVQIHRNIQSKKEICPGGEEE
jgi:hypothetical protein